MKRLALSALALSFALVGCATGPAPLATPAAYRLRPVLASAATGSDSSPKATSAPLEALAPGRSPGDFIRYRFTGKLLGGTVVLSEKILSREGGRITIEVKMSSKHTNETLVATFVDGATGRGEVLEVSGLDAEGNRVAKTLAEYEALMTKVALAADENEELLSSEESPRNIGGTELECRSASYRVIVSTRVPA